VTNTHSTARREEDRTTRLAKPPTSKGKERSKYKSASDDLHVDDPHFVLGIIEGAADLEWDLRAEPFFIYICKLTAAARVCDAYMRKVIELEADRIAYENNKQKDAPNISDVFEKSIEMLDVARKQILGYWKGADWDTHNKKQRYFCASW
jgi:hypothetical protein